MPTPPSSHIVFGTIFDIFGTKLADVIVTLTHETITPVISTTTDANGEYDLNLGDLSDAWSVGQNITLKASKTAEGVKSVTVAITSGGSQRHDITLAETSDFVYDTQVQNRTNIVMAIPLHYDGLKVTRERPLPILTENPIEKYQTADQDVNGDPQYFGFTDRFGNWYIQQYNVANGTFRYFKGTSAYSTNWTNRSTLSYDYFHNVF